MAHRSFVDEEEVLILSTRPSLPRWLRWFLYGVGILVSSALLVGAFVGWRYYSIQQRVKKDLAEFIAYEEEVRALGGINAAPDLLVDDAPNAWRYRYLSSIRARKERPITDLVLEKVDYDGTSARAYLQVDGIRQFRQYRLQQGVWRRAPFLATGWGPKQVLPLPEGIEIIYWEEDKTFAQQLATDVPKLLAVLQALGLEPTAETHRLVIIPSEFGERVRSAQKFRGIVINSPHVDLIPQEPGSMTPEQELRLALARKVLMDAWRSSPAQGQLPGTARVQAALIEVLGWAWAVGEVSNDAVVDWAAQLKGEWVSPVTGVPPDLITKLQPNAGEMAARLMMTYLLRKEGADALIALNSALATARTWDDAYTQAVGKTAREVEEAARLMARDPAAPVPEWPEAHPPELPTTVTFLSAPSGPSNLIMARTAKDEAIMLQMAEGAALTMVDGSSLVFDCIATGSTLRVRGRWIEKGLRMEVAESVLEQAVLPPVIQTPAISNEAWALVARKNVRAGNPGQLVALFPTGTEQILTSLEELPRVADPRSPPLLVWVRETGCNRPWIIAYRPDKGVVGAWLAPVGRALVDNPILGGGAEPKLFLMLKGMGTKIEFYETTTHHRLQPLSEDAWKQALAQLPEGNRVRLRAPSIPDAPNEIVAFDPATGEENILYRASPEEVAAFPVWLLGAPPYKEGYLLTRANRSEIVIFSRGNQGKSRSLVQFSRVQSILPFLARCPDGAYLYTRLERIADDRFQSILHLYRPDGRDEAVSDEFPDTYLFPYYCTQSKPR